MMGGAVLLGGKQKLPSVYHAAHQCLMDFRELSPEGVISTEETMIGLITGLALVSASYRIDFRKVLAIASARVQDIKESQTTTVQE